jgi:hypothetical protein
MTRSRKGVTIGFHFSDLAVNRTETLATMRQKTMTYVLLIAVRSATRGKPIVPFIAEIVDVRVSP